MCPKWKYAVAVNAMALSLLVTLPAGAVPTCTKVGERLCDSDCHLNEGLVAVNAYTCVEVESFLVPDLTRIFGTEYQDPPGWAELCLAVKDACSEWAAEGGGGN